MFKHFFFYILFFTAFLFFSGCSKRYAYFNKVNAPLKRGTVTIRLINYSPTFIVASFEKEVKDYCLKRLRKEGYNYTEKNPQYELVLEMKVDSSLNHGEAFVTLGGDPYVYSRISKGIQLKMEVRYIKTETLIWDDQYEMYYFNVYGRDLIRTKGVIKYMLSGLNDADK